MKRKFYQLVGFVLLLVTGLFFGIILNGRSQSTRGGLVEGMTLYQRMTIIKKTLHDPGSGTIVKKLLPDLEEVFIDETAKERGFPERILPFRYYYSPEANITVNICEVDRSVFICPGRLIHQVEIDKDRNCLVTDIYKETEQGRVL
jgi:hypothetical protein